MTFFWLTISFLTLLACTLICWPLYRKKSIHKNTLQTEANKIWYLERLQELEFALKQKELTLIEFEQHKTQLQKDFITQNQSDSFQEKILSPKKIHLFISLLLMVFISTAITLYQHLGASQQLQEQMKQEQIEKKADLAVKALGGENAVIEKLKNHLTQYPNEAQGWYLLGRVYLSRNEFQPAVAAFQKAARLAPDRSDIAVELAEASYLSPNKEEQMQTQAYLKKALALAPNDPAALNLSALFYYHKHQYEKAIEIWQTILLQTPENSSTAKALAAAIQTAETKLNQSGIARHEKNINLSVTVQIIPELAKKVKPHDVLFVYAKALNGPPMPLAITKVPPKLPTQVNLNDTMNMLPNLHLRDFSQLIIYARISSSGQALAQAGDLEGQSKIVSTQTPPKTVNVTIDHRT